MGQKKKTTKEDKEEGSKATNQTKTMTEEDRNSNKENKSPITSGKPVAEKGVETSDKHEIHSFHAHLVLA